jgi:hypothetical protein
MPKPKEAQGYDVAGQRYDQSDDPRASLEQAFQDYRTSIPSRNFTHRTNATGVTIYFHCHEQALGDAGKRAAVVDAASKAMDKFVSGLKRRHREMGAGTLDLTERKGSRGYRVDKASLNDRWELIYWRTYDVSDLIDLPTV